jgi:hypothetical protein
MMISLLWMGQQNPASPWMVFQPYKSWDVYHGINHLSTGDHRISLAHPLYDFNSSSQMESKLGRPETHSWFSYSKMTQKYTLVK